MVLKKSTQATLLMALFSIGFTAQAATLGTISFDNVPTKKLPSYSADIVTNFNKGDEIDIENTKSINGWYKLSDGSFIREEYVTIRNTFNNQGIPYQNVILISTPVYMERINQSSMPLFPGDKVNVIEYQTDVIKVNFAGEVGFIPMIVANNMPTKVQSKNDIVRYALQWEGNPYVYGGYSLTQGTDCSGFVKLIYQNYGVNLERSSMMQYLHNGATIDLTQIDLGDLIFYGKNGQVSHVALYIGNGKIIHAADEKQGIIISNMMINLPIIGIKRIY